MRTIFTGEDIKNIMETIFNGNLKQSILSKGEISYVNNNSEEILLINEDDNTSEKTDLAKYLNIKFYNWKERLVEKGAGAINENPSLSTFEDWVQSLNYSTKEAYGLVEVLDEEVTASQDIDNAVKIGKITFLIQTDKISNLDYYVSKIRNNFLGVPQTIQNSFGDILKAYIMVGTLIYEQEPITIQLGECLIVSCNFRISYLANALTYTDTKIEISLDGDDLYDENGEIVNIGGLPTTTKYLEMPITQLTWQNIFGSNPVPTAERPDLTGFIASSISSVKTLTFYDFNKELTMRFNDIFWQCCAFKKDGIVLNSQPVNIPIFIRVTSNGHFYIFKDIIDNMQKVLVNSDFNISSITLKGWGKIV